MTIGPMMVCASFGIHRGERLYSVKEVAEVIFDGKSERFVRDLIKFGVLQAVNIAVDPNGRCEYMIHESAIDDFLARRATKPPTVSSSAIKPARKRKSTVSSSKGFYREIQDHLRGKE